MRQILVEFLGANLPSMQLVARIMDRILRKIIILILCFLEHFLLSSATHTHMSSSALPRMRAAVFMLAGWLDLPPEPTVSQPFILPLTQAHTSRRRDAAQSFHIPHYNAAHLYSHGGATTTDVRTALCGAVRRLTTRCGPVVVMDSV